MSSSLEQVLDEYEKSLDKLKNTNSPSTKEVLAPLLDRDRIWEQLQKNTPASADLLVRLNDLDTQLKGQAKKVNKAIDLLEWQKIVNPSERSWWWFLEPPTHRWERFDWFWKALTIAFFTGSLGLTVDVGSRFLVGTPDTFGSLITATQGVLTVLAGRTALTKVGQDSVQTGLQRLKIPKHFWQEVVCGFAFSIFLFSTTLRLLLPQIAILYKNHGDRFFDSQEFASALSSYQRAIILNPDYIEPQYKMGSLYEQIQDIDKAREKYQLAVLEDFTIAYNNLGRLYLLDEDPESAIPLLLRGLDLIEENEPKNKDKYFLLKNLGWARLQQKRYADAEQYLQQAIDINSEIASSYCLLAQVLEGKLEGQEVSTNTQNKILENWELCLGYAWHYNVDEDRWIYIAQQRLLEREQ